MNKIKIFDATLRDGNHAMHQQLSSEQIAEYCKKIDQAGVDLVVVGHGNGLGASSLQVGLARETDATMLTVARKNLRHTKLGAYMIPGFGTIQDDIIPALACGVDVFKIGCHCTEADTTRQHIRYVKDAKKPVYGILMMYHMATTGRILEECQKMQSYGADGVIIMDSAGASTPEMVKKTISTIKNGLNIEVGFHSHNNMGLAVSNAYIAIQEGATIIDGTIRGLGAGAGNCQLEALVALLIKNNYELNANWYAMLDVSESIVSTFLKDDKGIGSVSIVSGVAGVFSAFKTQVMQAAAFYKVDPRDIFLELGKRCAVAGQEDMVTDIAIELRNRSALDQGISF